jgi:hypothetical protein
MRLLRIRTADLCGHGEGRRFDGSPRCSKGIQILHVPGQRTAVVIQLFETADYMAAAKGPSTRWTRERRRARASIDRCEINAELRPS